MSIYWQFLRLHLTGFIACNAVCIAFLWMSPYLALVFISKIVGYLSIYLVMRPMTMKYDYFFKNHGRTSASLFLTLSIADLLVFTALFIPLNQLL